MLRLLVCEHTLGWYLTLWYVVDFVDSRLKSVSFSRFASLGLVEPWCGAAISLSQMHRRAGSQTGKGLSTYVEEADTVFYAALPFGWVVHKTFDR